MITDEQGELLLEAFNDGSVYRNDSNYKIIKTLISNGLLHRGKPFYHEFEEEAAFELTSKGRLELNAWSFNRPHGDKK